MILSELPSSRIKDMTGQEIGWWTVLSFSHTAPDKGQNAYWLCRCKCGNEVTVSARSLRGGSSKSCGCFRNQLSKTTIKKTHNNGDHLYLMSCGPYTKIGRSSNVDKRLASIKASCPYPVELISVFENEGFMEHELHQKFADKHHSGEWFKLSDEDIFNLLL